MRVYIDTSALIKRSIDEEFANDLRDALDEFVGQGVSLLSSTLAWIEVSRGLRSRFESEAPARVADLIEESLSGVAEIPISTEIAGFAQRIGSPWIRSLDAIHLATATVVRADFVIAYDKRLLQSAAELGFRVSSPGIA